MAGSATRMLLLGAVALFEPVNGYQIRRELVSWRVDDWAHTNPGSIYHGLGQLASQGLLVRHDLDDGGRTVAVYELTPAGRAELARVQLAALSSYDAHDRADFTAALSMHSLLDPAEAVAALEVRRGLLAELVAEPEPPSSPYVPELATRGQRLQRGFAATELAWLDELLADVRAGRLPLGPAGDFSPPADDPGWAMERDRERYRRLLGR